MLRDLLSSRKHGFSTNGNFKQLIKLALSLAYALRKDIDVHLETNFATLVTTFDKLRILLKPAENFRLFEPLQGWYDRKI